MTFRKKLFSFSFCGMQTDGVFEVCVCSDRQDTVHLKMTEEILSFTAATGCKYPHWWTLRFLCADRYWCGRPFFFLKIGTVSKDTALSFYEWLNMFFKSLLRIKTEHSSGRLSWWLFLYNMYFMVADTYCAKDFKALPVNWSDDSQPAAAATKTPLFTP